MPEQLSDPRIQGFLATKEVVVLSTVQRSGAPLAMPMWFLHTPQALYMISVDGLQLGALTAIHPRSPRAASPSSGAREYALRWPCRGDIKRQASSQRLARARRKGLDNPAPGS